MDDTPLDRLADAYRVIAPAMVGAVLAMSAAALARPLGGWVFVAMIGLSLVCQLWAVRQLNGLIRRRCDQARMDEFLRGQRPAPRDGGHQRL